MKRVDGKLQKNEMKKWVRPWGTHSSSSFLSPKSVHSNKLFLSDSDSDSARPSKHTSSFLPTDQELIFMFQGQDAYEADPWLQKLGKGAEHQYSPWADSWVYSALGCHWLSPSLITELENCGAEIINTYEAVQKTTHHRCINKITGNPYAPC